MTVSASARPRLLMAAAGISQAARLFNRLIGMSRPGATPGSADERAHRRFKGGRISDPPWQEMAATALILLACHLGQSRCERHVSVSSGGPSFLSKVAKTSAHRVVDGVTPIRSRRRHAMVEC
jgi:hypothetical protein